MEAAGVIGEASGFGSKAEVEKERLEAAARCYELSTLVHIEDREDNHCQKEGQAKLAWRVTRMFGGHRIVCCSFLYSLS